MAQRTVSERSDALPFEGRLPSFDRATAWLNSAPWTTQDLRGSVVLVNFCTFTCINWLRQLPHVRAWARAYAGRGLVVIGVHTPEFGFEADADNVRRALRAMGVEYPVAMDNDYGVWNAFANHAWPALYLADPDGRIRWHHLGEGAYAESEAAIRTLLAKHGATLDPEPAAVRADGIEVPADWAALRSAETYVGYERTANFASPDGLTGDGARTYEVPPTLALDQWALRGQWIVGPQAAVSIAADGQIVYRFHARDLHLVLAPPIGGRARFGVRLDGRPPGADHGVDVDANGFGTLTEPRLYQLIRQAGPISDRTFEITFLDAGAGAYAFTFG